MAKNSPVAIFMAATAVLAANALQPSISNAGSKDSRMGGFKEWNTDQAVDADSALDKDAKAAAKKAKEQDICIPIGEGENCW